MTPAAILTIAALGQYGAGYAAGQHPTAYQQHPSRIVAVPLIERIKFVAVEHPHRRDEYFAELIGSDARAEARAAEEDAEAEDLAATVDRLAEAVAKLEARLAGPAPAPAAAEVAPPAPAPAWFRKLRSPATSPSADRGPAVLRANCAACHTGGSAKGQFTLFSAPGQIAELNPEQWGAVADAAISGRMPKGRPPVEGQDLADLLTTIATRPRKDN